jgi:hypothetical protein
LWLFERVNDHVENNVDKPAGRHSFQKGLRTVPKECHQSRECRGARFVSSFESEREKSRPVQSTVVRVAETAQRSNLFAFVPSFSATICARKARRFSDRQD